MTMAIYHRVFLAATAVIAFSLCFSTINAFGQDEPPKSKAGIWNTIKFDDLVEGKTLADGDIITVDVRENQTTSDLIKVNLVLSEGQWWKGILLFTPDRSNTYRRVVEGAGNEDGSFIAEFPARLLQTRELSLSKAKNLGVHVNTYWVHHAAEKMKGGNMYIFTWKKD
jgi:hypothetical protein